MGPKSQELSPYPIPMPRPMPSPEPSPQPNPPYPPIARSRGSHISPVSVSRISVTAPACPAARVIAVPVPMNPSLVIAQVGVMPAHRGPIDRAIQVGGIDRIPRLMLMFPPRPAIDVRADRSLTEAGLSTDPTGADARTCAETHLVARGDLMSRRHAGGTHGGGRITRLSVGSRHAERGRPIERRRRSVETAGRVVTAPETASVTTAASVSTAAPMTAASTMAAAVKCKGGTSQAQHHQRGQDITDDSTTS